MQEFGNQSKSYLSGILRNALNSFKACGYEAITVSGTAQYLTIPDGAKYALMKLVSSGTGDAANYLEFKLPVTASVGMPISDGTVFDVTDAQNLAGFNIIKTTAGAAFTTVLHVQYYK